MLKEVAQVKYVVGKAGGKNGTVISILRVDVGPSYQ